MQQRHYRLLKLSVAALTDDSLDIQRRIVNHMCGNDPTVGTKQLSLTGYHNPSSSFLKA